MERLTKKIPAANIRAVPVNIALDFAFELDDETWLGLQDIFDRLNEYEDTGLEPGEIKDQVAKLQDGRLVPVPRPGDVLYETDPAHGVVKHTVTDVYWGANTTAEDDNGQTWADCYTNEDIETAHTTREAAEAVLAAGSIMEGGPWKD